MLLLNLRYVVWCRDPFLSRQCQYPPQCHHQRPTGSPCHQHRCLFKGVWVVPLCFFWVYTCDLSWPIPVPVHRSTGLCFLNARELSREHNPPGRWGTARTLLNIPAEFLFDWNRGKGTWPKKTPFRTVLGKMDRCSIALCSILEWFRLPSCVGRQQIDMWCFPW